MPFYDVSGYPLEIYFVLSYSSTINLRASTVLPSSSVPVTVVKAYILSVVKGI